MLILIDYCNQNGTGCCVLVHFSKCQNDAVQLQKSHVINTYI